MSPESAAQSDYSFPRVYDLEGQVALVTGAAGGLGLPIARLLAQRGARLALVGKTARIHDAAASIGPAHLAWCCDVRDEAQIEATVAAVLARMGRIDILVNNAGIGVLADAEATPTELWDDTIAINLRGPFLFAREVGRHMLERGYGRIVNIASQAASVGLHGHVAYCSSKSGLLGMTRVLALEWAGRGVTVNAVSPTVVDSELARQAWPGEVGAAFRRKIPVGRFAHTDEIAHAVLYLASGAAGMTNGIDLIVDGGYTAT